jgi:serine/threonine protein phosphatase PrpC
LQVKGKPAEQQIVTALPDIRVVDLDPSDRFLILACDGIWDILTNEQAVSFVDEKLRDGRSPVEICQDMCDHCLASTTEGIGKGCDNMSVMIVLLDKPTS